MSTHSTHQLKAAIVSQLDIKSFYFENTDNQAIKIESSDGWSSRILCPFHDDKNNPAFFYNVKTGGFSCKTCGAGGSIFDFWLKKNGYNPEDKKTFRKAIVALANEAGLDIEQWKQSTKPIEKPTTDPAIPRKTKVQANDESKPPIESLVVDRFIKELRPEHYKYLNEKKGLNKRTIDSARIGWHPSWKYMDKDSKDWCMGRYAIPIFAVDGRCRNIRGYTPNADPAYKMANFITDKGKPNELKYGSPPRMYNIDKLDSISKSSSTHIVLTEGEWDCLLLNQKFLSEGLSDTWLAVTGTHGVKTFEFEWAEAMHGCNVYICFDCDQEGKLSSVNTANTFFLPSLDKFACVKMITLPLEGTRQSNDISDYFLDSGFNVGDFLELCDSSPSLISGSTGVTVEPVDVTDLVLAVGSREYIDKRVRVPIAISGNSSATYHAIREYKIVSCPLMGEGNCCCQDARMQMLPYGHPIFIQCCNSPEQKNLRIIAETVCHKGKKPRVEAVEKVVMEEYIANQVIKRWRAQDVQGHLQNTQELKQVPVYSLQGPDYSQYMPGNYIATGWIRSHPGTSCATLFVESLETMEEDWRKFDSTSKDNLDLLARFQEEFTIDDITSDIVNGVTKIYESDEILFAVLLTYLSPLHFVFNSDLLRGWLNVAIIGDSGTGKSATYIRLSDWLDLGDLFSALSGGRTGLLYAVKPVKGEWQVSAGRYVQSSRKIIAVDETQEMGAEEIKTMANAMDLGYLQVERVAFGGYETRTRVIFIMNPKDARGRAATISSFTSGCSALRNCFDPMFIRRLDLAVFVTGQHDYDFYNKSTVKEEVGTRLTAKMMRALIYWAWTRTVDQIQWSEDATRMCLSKSTELSGKFGYTDDVPLVNPQDFRNNLARLSTAYAVLDRNFSSDMQSVIVEDKHVIAVSSLVDKIYSSPVCGLDIKSESAKVTDSLDDQQYKTINRDLTLKLKDCMTDKDARSKSSFSEVILNLQDAETCSLRDLSFDVAKPRGWVSNCLSLLQGHNLIGKNKAGYYKTKKWNLFMSKWREEEVGKLALLIKDESVNIVTIGDLLDYTHITKYRETSRYDSKTEGFAEEFDETFYSGTDGDDGFYS